MDVFQTVGLTAVVTVAATFGGFKAVLNGTVKHVEEMARDLAIVKADVAYLRGKLEKDV